MSAFIDKLVVNNKLTFTAPIIFKRKQVKPHTHHTHQQTDLTPQQQVLIRGHKWLRQLETQQVSSIRDIAKQTNIAEGTVSNMLNITRLAPDIVQDILDNTLSPAITITHLTRNLPNLWCDQREQLLSDNKHPTCVNMADSLGCVQQP